MTLQREPNRVPDYVQTALDQVREDLIFLRESLNIWQGQPDIWERVENWQFNTWRHMEEILADTEPHDQ